MPPHLGRELVRRVAVGDRIRVRGVKPRRAEMIAAVQLTGRDGVDIVDDRLRMRRRRSRRTRSTTAGIERRSRVALHGPKGELNGALLTSGVALRVPPHAAEALHEYLRPGVHVQAWGHGVVTPHGTTLDVSEIAEPSMRMPNDRATVRRP